MASRGMASPSDSVISKLLMSLMSPKAEQGRVLPTGQRVMEPTPPAGNTIFDQSQQPTLGGLKKPRTIPPGPIEGQVPRLPSQLISPSNEMMAKLLAQAMFSGRGR